jgi:cyclopropane fatty-acyl-phospholipid synthase-like methyltransferase
MPGFARALFFVRCAWTGRPSHPGSSDLSSTSDSTTPAALPFAPAPERNKRPILAQLLDLLPATGSVLEVGAGTGQHAVFFAPKFPGLVWQATERAAELDGLRRRLEAEGGSRLPPPLELDVMRGGWPAGPFSAAFSANTAHIMSWEAVGAMFAGLGACLEDHGPFCLYGPFQRDGRHTAASNAHFDRQLRERSQEMGLRDIGELERLAGRHQMILERTIDMPTNNFLLVFRKLSGR